MPQECQRPQHQSYLCFLQIAQSYQQSSSWATYAAFLVVWYDGLKNINSKEK
ncbi:hypothetical protein ACLUXD_05490 [Loigolactobacillus coryniformis subsp. coryniformis]